LDYVVKQGGVITDAVRSQKWPGEAKVHVSIVNWIDNPASLPPAYTIDGVPVSGVRSDIAELGGQQWAANQLPANAGHCFQGPIPVGAGFVLTDSEARELLSQMDVSYRDVVRPYLTASDIAESPSQSPSRWIIDFAQLPLQDAARYPAALQIVRERVRPVRETVRRDVHRRNWWLFGEPRVGLRKATASLTRSIAAGRHGKRLTVAWVPQPILASHATVTFAFDDDYSMGILLSKAHDAWVWAQSSSLKGDLRYTPTSVFLTFPFPDPVTDEQRERVAVAECYGWPRAVAQDERELVRLLTERNREISEGRQEYAPFR
jgi:hypothetical protein